MVDHALAVLTAFKKGDGELSLAELTKRTGLVKTTVMRLALWLEGAGLIKRIPDGGYRLDAEVMRLAACYQQAFGLADNVMHVQPGDLRPMDQSAIAEVLRHFDHGRSSPAHEVPIYTSGGSDLRMADEELARACG